jgi:5,10-methenyltetrahydromethanopterin hydrogenase
MYCCLNATAPNSYKIVNNQVKCNRKSIKIDFYQHFGKVMQELRAIPSEALMFRTPDDLVLKVLSQVIEIITVACHAYNQVTVQLRMFLRLTEGVGADNVELDVVAVKAEVTPDKRGQLLVASFILEELR